MIQTEPSPSYTALRCQRGVLQHSFRPHPQYTGHVAAPHLTRWGSSNIVNGLGGVGRGEKCETESERDWRVKRGSHGYMGIGVRGDGDCSYSSLMEGTQERCHEIVEGKRGRRGGGRER